MNREISGHGEIVHHEDALNSALCDLRFAVLSLVLLDGYGARFEEMDSVLLSELTSMGIDRVRDCLDVVFSAWNLLSSDLSSL